MNINNLSLLVQQLQKIGLEDATAALMKRVCFQPQSFYIDRSIMVNNITACFRFVFKKSADNTGFNLSYYDASIQNMVLPKELSDAPIDVSSLQQDMAAIDWQAAFAADSKVKIVLAQQETWKQEALIASVMERLMILEGAPAGKSMVAALKQKYWGNTVGQHVLGRIPQSAVKPEVSQRFFIPADGDPITMNEALRFLQNKRLEKQMTNDKRIIKGTTGPKIQKQVGVFRSVTRKNKLLYSKS